MASAPGPWEDFAGTGMAPAEPATDPSQLPREQRNAMLAAKLREPNVSDTDVLNYAQQLGLTITGHLRENLHKPFAKVISTDASQEAGPWQDFQPSPPAPPPPDTRWKHDAAVGAHGAMEGVLDLLSMAKYVATPGNVPAQTMAGAPIESARTALDAADFGQPQTTGQQFLHSTVRGATAAGPFGVEGGVAGGLMTMGAGGGSGLAGEAAKQAGYGPGVQFLASLAGGGIVAGPMAAGRAVGSAVEGTGAEDLIAAAGRRNVTLSAADVNPRLRNTNAYLESSPGSHGPVRANIDAGMNDMEREVHALAPPTGDVAPDALAAGTRIQAAGRRYIDQSRSTRNGLYTRAENLAGDAQITPAGTLKAIDDHIARLSETPNANAPDLGVLNTIRRDLVNADGSPKALSVAAMRDVRRSARALADQATLAPDRTDAIVEGIARGATGDITSQLASANPRAAAAYATADAFHGQRADMIREVVSRFLGPRNNPFAAERALKTMKSMARGDNGDDARLGRMLDTLQPEEHSDIAATFADGLGRRSPEEPFSPALFVSQVRQIAPEARVRLFGKDGAEAIDDLIRIGIAKRGTVAGLNNSKSGVVANYREWLRSSLGQMASGGVGYAVGGPIGGAVGIAAPAASAAVLRNVGARLFTNPNFVRWLGRAPRTSGATAIRSHIGKLSVVAASQPQIANEVMALQSRLSEAFGHGALKAAANPGDQKQDAGTPPIEENQ